MTIEDMEKRYAKRIDDAKNIVLTGADGKPLPPETEPLWSDEDYAVAKEVIETTPHTDRTKPGDEFGGSAATDPGPPADISGDDAEDARKMAEWDAENP